MNEEQYFLEAINASEPNADLIYADWLEEQGRPEADEVRNPIVVMREWHGSRSLSGSHSRFRHWSHSRSRPRSRYLNWHLSQSVHRYCSLSWSEIRSRFRSHSRSYFRYQSRSCSRSGRFA